MMLHIIIKATYSSFKIITLMLPLIIIKPTYSSFKITTLILHLIIKAIYTELQKKRENVKILKKHF